MQRVSVPRRNFFFFQAEDGIRDVAVTGVQTCALPIYAEQLGILGLERRGQGGGLAVARAGNDLPLVDQVHVAAQRSEEHTSELQSRLHLVCRLLLEKKRSTNASRRAPTSASTTWTDRS